MRQIGAFRRLCYKASTWVEFLIGPVTVGYGFVTKVQPATYKVWPAPAPAIVEWCQRNSFPIVLTIGGSAIVVWLLRWRGNPWFWDKLQALLNRCQEVAYDRFKGHIKDHHRVTLFRHQTWYLDWRHPFCPGGQPWSWKDGRLPWSGWLVPVLRSGNTSQRTRAVFLAPDAGSKAEGIAGKAWASNSIAYVDKLKAPDRSSNDRKKKVYARRTNCSDAVVESYVKDGRSLPSSIGANMVEVNGKPWGVLVFDSADPDGVTGEVMTNFTVAMLSISQLLEKAK